jgi:flavodoxin
MGDTMEKILVAYASFAGATREVAEAVARDLENGSAAVEVRPARDVTPGRYRLTAIT